MEVGSLGANVFHNGPTKTDSPTLCASGEEDAFQWMGRTTLLGGPMHTGVVCVDDCAFRSYGPTFHRIKKLYVVQIC